MMTLMDQIFHVYKSQTLHTAYEALSLISRSEAQCQISTFKRDSWIDYKDTFPVLVSASLKPRGHQQTNHNGASTYLFPCSHEQPIYMPYKQNLCSQKRRNNGPRTMILRRKNLHRRDFNFSRISRRCQKKPLKFKDKQK